MYDLEKLPRSSSESGSITPLRGAPTGGFFRIRLSIDAAEYPLVGFLALRIRREEASSSLEESYPGM